MVLVTHARRWLSALAIRSAPSPGRGASVWRPLAADGRGVHRALVPAALPGRFGLLAPAFERRRRAGSVLGGPLQPDLLETLGRRVGLHAPGPCRLGDRARHPAPFLVGIAASWPAAAFPIIVLTLASRDFGVLFILPMVAGLAAAWLYVVLGDKPPNGWAQSALVGLFLIASIPLYWLLASGFLYLCVMCALFELLVRKRPAWCLAWIVFGAAVPFGVSYVLLRAGRRRSVPALDDAAAARRGHERPGRGHVSVRAGRSGGGLPRREVPVRRSSDASAPARCPGRRVRGARVAGLAAGRASFRHGGLDLRGLPA